ncbi:MAG: hypothetical protein V7L00_29670 [Nostoc sp.]|uniref:hypothetical protein n=1 Tax=Nostoc sp. TaxID=1180 RepID=UPI002FFBE099
MNQGFYLSLQMGDVNASPVPQPVIDALTEIQITSTVGSQSGFQMKFTLGKNSILSQVQLPSGYFDPRRRVIITVVVNGISYVLMDGIITQQDVTPSNKPGQSILTITGLDLTALMDFIDLTGIPYPGLPMFAVMGLILAKYLVLGVVPMVIPSAFDLIKNPLDGYRKQIGTDYQYITCWAEKYGNVFYLDPGPTPGMSTAYWGPSLSLFESPQPALSVNMDAATNVESLSFTYDGLQAKQYIVTILEPTTKIPIPILAPDLSILGPTLATKAATPLRTEILPDIANKSIAEATLLTLGALISSSEAITANGELNVLRYGHILKARKTVAVRGAGLPYDGLYQVKSVTHNIKRGEYKQSFSLARGGVMSTLSQVAV